VSEPGWRLVFEDAALLVVDKPAGLLAVPGRGADKQDCLSARLQARWPEARVVHRLDQPTSGLMVFARDAATQRRLGTAFEQREVTKRYIALVAGRLADAEGCIELPLAADWPNRPRQQVDAAAGKPALTRWWRLADDPARDASRVELEPLTGRTHQLRVHLAAIGHPILGDALYAPPEVQARAARLLLHASRLAFAHPGSGAALDFERAAPF
jgi:tRNA pseudouridine32 synthase/23S rRNA pseudouridine746 synthase